MRFGMLGSVTVWADDGAQVRVPETKVRALLADLLVHNGRAVAADRLIADLWGEHPPHGAAAALRAKVSQLRRALDGAEPGARGLLLHQPPGYRLRIGEQDTDAGAFEALTGRARSVQDPRSRRALLAEALALWRGPAFADFADEEFARPTATRLAELRLAAVEDFAETRLALGEQQLLAGELAEEGAAHPLRERLCALYVRALYASGRHGDALAAQDALRARLREELGVDPGPELAELQQAVLRHDPSLAARPAGPGKRPRSEVPAAVTELIGREGDLTRVKSLLGRHRLLTLVGPGGVGKTRLALEAARAQAASLADGVVMVDLTVCDSPLLVTASSCSAPGAGEVARVVTEACGLREEDLLGEPHSAHHAARPDLTTRLAEALRGHTLLLVLDNCEPFAEAVAEVAATLLAGAPQLRLLATSREPLGVAGEALWQVEPLALPGPGAQPSAQAVASYGAVRLFAERAAATAPDFRVAADNVDDVLAVCRRLDGLPLALELAAARVRALGMRELAKRIEDRFTLLTTGPRSAPPRQRTLRAAIDWSWELLDTTERAVLRRLAVHGDSWTLEAAEAVAAADPVRRGDIVDVLARLVDRSLVVMRDGPDGPRYRMLESVLVYSLDRLREAGEDHETHERFTRHYLSLAEQAARESSPGERERWLRRLDAEVHHLRGAMEWALHVHDTDIADRLVEALAGYRSLRGLTAEAGGMRTVPTTS
jgi:predicted ATPase/DNA-binding SARP family transcriptional activator